LYSVTLTVFFMRVRYLAFRSMAPTRVTAAGGVRDKIEAEFDASANEGLKIPDLGLDGGEMGHEVNCG